LTATGAVWVIAGPIARNGTRSRHNAGADKERETLGMSKKLFVGSLSWSTTDETLREAFARFGEVTEAKVITDRDTGRSRGFGFVTFNESEEANAAISALNGTELDGRAIKVNEALDKGPRRGGGGGGFGGGGGGGGRDRW